jgi:hypothetical protein
MQEALCSCRSVMWLPRTASAIRPLVRSVERFQGTGNRRAAARTRRPPATSGSAIDDMDRPVLSGGGQPLSASQPLASLHRDAGDVAALASAVGGQALDVHRSRRVARPSVVRSESWSCVWRERTRKGGYQRCKHLVAVLEHVSSKGRRPEHRFPNELRKKSAQSQLPSRADPTEERAVRPAVQPTPQGRA